MIEEEHGVGAALHEGTPANAAKGTTPVETQSTGQQAAVSLRLTLPLPPGVNNQYVTVNRRRVLSGPAKAFKRDVAKLVERARMDGTITGTMERALKDSLLGVYLTFYFETPHRRDLDGGLKIALDALCGELGVDDRMVVDLHLTKRIDPLRPHLDVELETIANWSFDRSYVYLGDALHQEKN